MPAYAAQYGHFTAANMAAALQGFSGVLASSPALQQAAHAAKLHAQVRLFTPIASQSPYSTLRRDAPYTVAFIGGAHRADAFKTFVFPALQGLSQTIDRKSVV